MKYELTRYGKEYLEALPARLQEGQERAMEKSFMGSRGQPRVKLGSTYYRQSRREYLLRRIEKGEDPLIGAFDYFPTRWGRRKEMAINSLRKELIAMLKDNLIREVLDEGNIIYRPGLETTLGREMSEWCGFEEEEVR